SKMKQKQALSQNRSYQSMIKEIGERIAGVAQVDLPGTEWEFVVFQKDEPNAFAMPGGKVGVNTGLIDLAAGNEDEVAAVMGHEIAHVALRHSNKRMSQAIGLGVGGVILDVALRNQSSTERMLGTNERVPTLLYNGYGEQVASLYQDKADLGDKLYR
ncbi:MAG: hypothetical protein EBY62_10675, partial [Cellvibrionales bacterium]|nr:hypothetical protein [Cellvibrionales bacterium]